MRTVNDVWAIGSILHHKHTISDFKDTFRKPGIVCLWYRASGERLWDLIVSECIQSTARLNRVGP